jgi:hypothetical protein|tara:strand:- start:3488 stop:3655 length:168 start_codon:yes stop_codon:yes gene_type:complete
MKKAGRELQKTTNSRVYNMAVNELVSSCPFCAPHRGCNKKRDNNSWKNYRKSQWK